MLIRIRYCRALPPLLAGLVVVMTPDAAMSDVDVCTLRPAFTLSRDAPWSVSRSSEPETPPPGTAPTVLLETVQLDESTTLRIEVRACTAYGVDYVLRTGAVDGSVRRPSPVLLTGAIRSVAPYDRSPFRLERIAELLETTPYETLVSETIDLPENDGGGFFLLIEDEMDGLPVLRLRVVVFL